MKDFLIKCDDGVTRTVTEYIQHCVDKAIKRCNHPQREVGSFTEYNLNVFKNFKDHKGIACNVCALEEFKKVFPAHAKSIYLHSARHEINSSVKKVVTSKRGRAYYIMEGTVSFCQLYRGSRFWYADTFYIKIPTCFTVNETRKNCINFSGSLCFFHAHTQVHRVR